RNKLTQKANNPDFAFFLIDQWLCAMHLSFGDEANIWGINNGRLKVDEMFQLTFYSEKEFFIVMTMWFIDRRFNLPGPCSIELEYGKGVGHILQLVNALCIQQSSYNPSPNLRIFF